MNTQLNIRNEIASFIPSLVSRNLKPMTMIIAALALATFAYLGYKLWSYFCQNQREFPRYSTQLQSDSKDQPPSGPINLDYYITVGNQADTLLQQVSSQNSVTDRAYYEAARDYYDQIVTCPTWNQELLPFLERGAWLKSVMGKNQEAENLYEKIFKHYNFLQIPIPGIAYCHRALVKREIYTAANNLNTESLEEIDSLFDAGIQDVTKQGSKLLTLVLNAALNKKNLNKLGEADQIFTQAFRQLDQDPIPLSWEWYALAADVKFKLAEQNSDIELKAQLMMDARNLYGNALRGCQESGCVLSLNQMIVKIDSSLEQKTF